MYLGVDKIYVINLERHSLRRKNIKNSFSKLNINYQFIKGIDWKDYSSNLSQLNKHISKEFFDPNGWFSYGIICCALSHRKAWGEFLQSDAEYALFLEDDVFPTNYLKEFDFQQLNSDLKQLDWGVCFLGKYNELNNIDKHVVNNLYKYLYFDITQFAAHAYILNKKSAQWYYNNTKNIKYAADIRLEISPFNALIVKNSLFRQRHRKFLPYTKDIFNRRKHLLEFFHHTTEDIEEGKEWGFEEKFYNTRSKQMIVNEKLPIKKVEENTIILNNKQLKGYKFYLYE